MAVLQAFSAKEDERKGLTFGLESDKLKLLVRDWHRVYARLVEVHYGTDVCINPPSGDGQPH